MQAHAYTMRSIVFLQEARNHIVSIGKEGSGAISSIKSSVSAVEAFLNEFCQIGIGYQKHEHTQKNPMVRMAESLREAEAQRVSTKRKICIAFEELTGAKLKKGQVKEFQRFSLVIDVRNELAHPKVSVIEITSSGLNLPKKEQLLVKKLKSNGFSLSKESFDWLNIIKNKEFALWSYQVSIGMIGFLLDHMPYKHAIDTYKQIYTVNLTNPEQWPMA